MVAIGCSMAGSHEAETRSTRFAQALYAAGNATPDRGMLDRTYGEALGLIREAV